MKNSINSVILTKEQTVNILVQTPYLFGHAVGFNLLNELHNDWIKNMVFGTGDVTLQAHRGSYKTTAVSIALSEIMLLNPNEKVMFMRKSDNDVKEIIEQTKKILENPVTKELSKNIYGIPVKLIKSSATEVSTNLTNDPRGTSQLVGRGIKGSLTGKHFDRIFTDDIVNVQDRISKAEREHTKTVYQELQNIKNRGGRIFNTGTPWHKDDCFCLMPNPVKYDCYSTGLISEEQISELKNRMLNSLFAANYELKHVADDDVIFANPRIHGDPSMIMNTKYSHIDAAYNGEDYTAFTICKKVDGTYYVLGKLWRKHIDDVEDEIISIRKQYLVRNIYCEENGDKGYLAKDLKKRGEHPVSYYESTNKFLKITSYLKSEWKDVVFVDGTDEEYINQICEYNENAEHDDAPDSLSCLVRLLWDKGDRYRVPWER